MAAYLETFYTAIRTAVAASWPDVKANGIFEAEHQGMIPWGTLTPPCAAIAIPSLPRTDDWGITWNAYEPHVEIYYVANITGGSSAIRAKLETLRDYLLTTGLTTGQVLSVEDLSWSDDIEANQVMISKDYGQRAGRLRAHILLGEVYP